MVCNVAGLQRLEAMKIRVRMSTIGFVFHRQHHTKHSGVEALLIYQIRFSELLSCYDRSAIKRLIVSEGAVFNSILSSEKNTMC